MHILACVDGASMMRQHCFVLLIALVFPHISVAKTIPKPFIFVN
jgi:hypothetical protein